MIKEQGDVAVLAIESSCDETAAAVVVNGRDVRSNIISSQIALHTLYGGVVPEIASRKHIEKINQVITEAMETAGADWSDLDAVAVTYGPGLVMGRCSSEIAEAKAISYARKLPLIGVHHIEGHISCQLHREQGVGTAVFMPCGIRRPYPSCEGGGLWSL